MGHRGDFGLDVKVPEARLLVKARQGFPVIGFRGLTGHGDINGFEILIGEGIAFELDRQHQDVIGADAWEVGGRLAGVDVMEVDVLVDRLRLVIARSLVF